MAVNWTERSRSTGRGLAVSRWCVAHGYRSNSWSEMVADGWSEERIMTSYPTLTEADIRACLHYAAALLREEKRFRLPAAG